jgi:hypothetical protein
MPRRLALAVALGLAGPWCEAEDMDGSTAIIDLRHCRRGG